ncbi:MAG TPA: hypothetical protein VMN57_10670 [Anaerolineales bacterium]|nr:hypothetical protein [Anaerolineales bacterium]
MSAKARDQLETRLTGRPLILARSLWIVVVALAVGLYVLSIPIQFAHSQTVCSGATCPWDQLSPTGVEQLQQAGQSLGFYAGYLTALNAILALGFSIVAAVIFWRKSDDWMGIFASLTLVLFGITFNSVPITTAENVYPALLFLSKFLNFLGNTCLILFFYLLPDGRFVPRWILWLVPFVVVHKALSAFRPELLGKDWFVLVELASMLFAQIYRYRHVANSVQRQQTTWVVFGTTLAVSGAAALFLYIRIAWPGGNPIIRLIVSTALHLIILQFPLSIGMAILRSRLWDIDLLIRRTLIYSALTGLLALAYFGSVVGLQGLVRLITGQSQSQLVTVVSTLVIAALFVPLRGRVQEFIDRRFYRRKYDAARTLAAFGNSVRNEVDLGRLAAHLIKVVDETLQPETVSLWLKG